MSVQHCSRHWHPRLDPSPTLLLPACLLPSPLPPPRSQVQGAWRTDEIRRRKPSPQDESREGLTYFHETIYSGLPVFLRRIDTALKNIGQPMLPLEAKLFSFGGWVGVLGVLGMLCWLWLPRKQSVEPIMLPWNLRAYPTAVAASSSANKCSPQCGCLPPLTLQAPGWGVIAMATPSSHLTQPGMSSLGRASGAPCCCCGCCCCGCCCRCCCACSGARLGRALWLSRCSWQLPQQPVSCLHPLPQFCGWIQQTAPTCNMPAVHAVPDVPAVLQRGDPADRAGGEAHV
jgi:hypothetical protein